MGYAASPFLTMMTFGLLALGPTSPLCPAFLPHGATETLRSPPRAAENWGEGGQSGEERGCLQPGWHLRNSPDHKQTTVMPHSPNKPTGPLHPDPMARPEHKC